MKDSLVSHVVRVMVFASFCYAPQAHAAATGGYDGLISQEEPETYKFAYAAPKDDPGYAGLVSGAVPERKAPLKKSVPAAEAEHNCGGPLPPGVNPGDPL